MTNLPYGTMRKLWLPSTMWEEDSERKVRVPTGTMLRSRALSDSKQKENFTGEFIEKLDRSYYKDRVF